MKQIDELIDEVLKTEPSFQLRGDFKDGVIKKLRGNEKKHQYLLYLWMFLGVLIIFSFGYGTIAYFTPSLLSNFGSLSIQVEKIVLISVLVGVSLILIQYLDGLLVRKKSFPI